MTTIGFIGSGNIGKALATVAIDRGHDVVLSNSRGPQTLTDLVAELGDHARAATAEEAAREGDIVVVTVPFGKYKEVPTEGLDGKTVIDTNNYYWERDGRHAELDEGKTSESELLQVHLKTAHVVRAFNNIMAQHIVDDGKPAGTPGRRALPITGDDGAAKKTVAELIDSFGFDVVDVGALAESDSFKRDTPAYGAVATADELRNLLAKA